MAWKLPPFFKGYDHVLPELALSVAALYLVAVCIHEPLLAYLTEKPASRPAVSASGKIADGRRSPLRGGAISGPAAPERKEMTISLPPAADAPDTDGAYLCRLGEEAVRDAEALQRRLQAEQAKGLAGVRVLTAGRAADDPVLAEVMQVLLRLRIPTQLEGMGTDAVRVRAGDPVEL